MAVSTTNAVSGPYVANGSTTAFPFTFKCLTSGELSVISVAGDGTETNISSSAYSVTVNSGGNGGTVTFDVAPDNCEVFIYSDPEFTQETGFASGQAFSPSVVNEALDRATVRDQYLLQRLIDVESGGPQGALFSQSINYAPGLIGAAIRRRGIDVRDGPYYAADGGGTTEVTDQLASAILDGKTRGCPVLFGDDVYLTGQLDLTSDNFWFGEKAVLKAYDPLNQDVLHGSIVDNIYLRGLIIDGDMPATLTRVGTFGQGIHLLKGSNVILRNVKAINCLENGLRVVGISHGWFENCEASYCGHNGMYFSGYSDGTADLADCHIIGPITTYNATDGLCIEFAAKHIQVIAPRSLNNGAGNGVATCPYVGGGGIIVIGYDRTNFPEDVIISDGYTSENYAGGCYVLGSVAVTIDNFRSSNDGMGATIAEATFGHGIAVYSTGASYIENRDITINNPTINNCAKHGIWVEDGLTLGGKNTGVQVIGGVIRNPGLKQSNTYDGISAQNTVDLMVTGTVVYDDGSPQFMRYSCSVASTCTNPRISIPNFHAGLSGTLSSLSTTTQYLFVDYTNGKMIHGHGTSVAPGASFEVFRSGTGTVDYKVRNNNVTAAMFVDSGAAYFGSSTAHPALLTYGGVEVMRLDNGRATMAAPLKLKSYTVAALPGSPVAGDCALVTDANATTFNSTVAGGGANVVKVYYNGTNWKIG